MSIVILIWTVKKIRWLSLPLLAIIYYLFEGMVQKWQHACLVTWRLQEKLAICHFIGTWNSSACWSYHEKNTFNCNLNIDLYFISNCILNMSNFLYALAESISLSYFKKTNSGLNRDKKRWKRTGTCKYWTLEQNPYLPGQKEKGLAWLFQLYQCRCWYYREIKQCDCMSNFVAEQIKLNQDIPSNWSFA